MVDEILTFEVDPTKIMSQLSQTQSRLRQSFIKKIIKYFYSMSALFKNKLNMYVGPKIMEDKRV